ncbi:sensor histidine kinase [Streptomyces sp. NPDC051561]|uniref:sensor histidine kinase n=1 Tax=Streptomyces sp. NPDC051561 TaxID=3365658 RepID=UPI0037A991A3
MTTDVQRWGWARKSGCAAGAVLLLAPALLGPPLGFLFAFSALVAVLAVLVPLPWGRITLPVAASAATGLSVVADVGYSGHQGIALLWMPFEFVALLVLVGRLVRGVRRRVVPVAGLAALLVLAVPLRFTLRNPASGANVSLSMVLIAMVPVAGALLIGGHLRTTDARRRRAVVEARQDQRLHMARVLHDFVAHELTGMLIEVQAARATPHDPDQHRELLGRLEESGLRALDQMDRALHTLRQPDEGGAGAGAGADTEALPAADHSPLRVHGLADLPELVDRFSASGSAPAVLDLDAELVGALREEADETAYSMVIEALTNVRRHAAEASSVSVSVRREGGDRLCVAVTDDAGGGGGGGGLGGRGGVLLGQREGGGTGLVGMRERFVVLGGELSAGATGTGWQVSGTLPVQGAAVKPLP